MNFNISQETGLEGDKNLIVITLANELNKYFSSRDYGKSIQHYFIGLICVKPEFDTFFKIRKPKYKENEKVKLLSGDTKELKGVYSYDIKLNFQQFINSTEEQSKALLAREILKSLTNLNALPKKVKDFNKEQYKADMEHFFKEQQLI